MNELLKSIYDKALLGIAAAALLASGLWFWQQQGEVRRLRGQAVAAVLSGAAYSVSDLHPPATEVAAWPKATAQSSGPGWLYEVFTPPVIYYNTLAKSFSVSPPGLRAAESEAFGVALLAVKREQYRLQLVGYFGEPGDYRVAFESPGNPETLLVREGKHFRDLGLTLKSFAVKKVLVPHDDPWPVYDIAALAVLQDDRTGGDVVLDSRSRKFTGTPLAVLKLTDGDGSSREVREGDSFSSRNSIYRIERVQLDPPEVVVARQTPGLPQPETKVLHIAAAGSSSLTTQTTLTPNRPATGLAVTGN